jgi:UDP-glucose 4-epimerase
MNDILLLGGNGFIGTHLQKAFEKSLKRNVWVLDQLGSTEGRSFKGDFSDPLSYREILRSKKISTVISAVGSSVPGSASLDQLPQELQRELNPHLQLFEEMHRAQVRELVFFSSGGTVYGAHPGIIQEDTPQNPISVYGMVKSKTEASIRTEAKNGRIDFLILRPSNPYGLFHRNPHQGLINVTLRKIKAGEEIAVWGDGSVIRDYIYASDMAQCVVDLLKSSTWNEAYHLASGQTFSVKQILEKIQSQLGPFRVRYESGRTVDVPQCILSNEKLVQMISPRFTELDEGIRKTWSWLNEN